MQQTETRMTDTFQVQCEDGSINVVTEVTTFLIHEGTEQRAPCQIVWFLGGESLIRDQSDHDIFRNGLRGEIFRRIRSAHASPANVR
jgi:hypothetical protein